MKPEFLKRLCCPATGQPLKEKGDFLVSEDGQHQYPIRSGIPRFVPASNYADNFGMQWNRFARTQLDSHTGHPISAQRFWRATGWKPSDLRGKWVLDVGCGSGRFAEVALSAGAQVVALDYSNAVDACWANLNQHPNLHVVQGDIYALPFVESAFHFVYSLGTLQHTPQVKRDFSALPPMLAGGGHLCVDFYEKTIKTCLHPKYFLRIITRRMDNQFLLEAVQKAAPVLLPVSLALGRVPWAGKFLSRLIPVANYHGTLPLSKAQLREWAVLDTFDWLSPCYDNPQTLETVRRWMLESGLTGIEIQKLGHLVARGNQAPAGHSDPRSEPRKSCPETVLNRSPYP